MYYSIVSILSSSNSSVGTSSLTDLYLIIPVPAGINLPIITFSFNPINGKKINDKSFGASFFSYSKMIYIYDINRDDYENDYYINSENYDVIQFETKDD